MDGGQLNALAQTVCAALLSTCLCVFVIVHCILCSVSSVNVFLFPVALPLTIDYWPLAIQHYHPWILSHLSRNVCPFVSLAVFGGMRDTTTTKKKQPRAESPREIM